MYGNANPDRDFVLIGVRVRIQVVSVPNYNTTSILNVLVPRNTFRYPDNQDRRTGSLGEAPDRAFSSSLGAILDHLDLDPATPHLNAVSDLEIVLYGRHNCL